MRLCVLTVLFLIPGASATQQLADVLTKTLQPLMQSKSAYWNNSALGLTLYSPKRELALNLQAGVVDRATGAAPTPETRYLFGSATKMFTATAILKLVEERQLALAQPMAPLVDQALRMLSNTSLDRLGFNKTVQNVTVLELLSMRSGLYDLPEELRDWQNAAPAHDFGPVELLTKSIKQMACTPGSCGVYSDVNYILLGLVLMVAQNSTGPPIQKWENVVQDAAVPSGLNLNSTTFVKHGMLGEYEHAAHGYQPDGSDVINISALGGWTCGNVLSTTEDMARWVYALYGDHQCRVVSCATVLQMVQFQQLSRYFPVWYGMGTMAIYSDYWGHGGATWGFYSLSGYNPYLDFSFVLSTNMETYLFQENIMDVHETLYSAIKGILNSTAI